MSNPARKFDSFLLQNRKEALTDRLAEGLCESLSLGHFEGEDFGAGEHSEGSLLAQALRHTHAKEGRKSFVSDSRLARKGRTLPRGRHSEVLTLGPFYQYQAGHRSE